MKAIWHLLPLCLVGIIFAGPTSQDKAAPTNKQHLWSLFFGLAPQKRATTLAQLQTQKEWTVIIYLAADNNLHDEAYLNLEQMKTVGSSEHANILAYLDVTDPDQGKVGLQLFVEKNNIVILGTEPLADSGSADTFANAILQAIQKYPSQHLAIIMWNHGAGDLSPARQIFPRVGVCFDDTCDTYLDDAKLKDAFGRILKARKGKKIDIILFDACLMAGTATAWLMHPFADYMVASEQTIPGDGFPYQEILKPFAKGVVNSETIVKNMVKCYQKCYATLAPDYTSSAFKLSAVPSIAQNIDTLARLLSNALKQQVKNSVSKMIKAARKPTICMHFDEPSYVDLYALYANLLTGLPTIDLGDKKKTAAMKAALQKTLQDGRKALKTLIAANACGGLFKDAGGLSIFFPDTKNDDPTYAAYAKTEFAKNNYWLTFLKTYGTL